MHELKRYSLWAGTGVSDILPLREGTSGSMGGSERRPPPSRSADRGPSQASTGGVSGPDRKIFVGVLLGASRDDAAADYRDAVGAFSKATGFVPDERFRTSIESPHGDDVQLWGWMPPGKVAEALSNPNVHRLEMGGGASSVSAETAPGSEAELLLALRRLGGPVEWEVFEARAKSRLAERASFQWRRTVGIQLVPHSNEAVLVVSGSVPLNRIGRLLSEPMVLKAAPSPVSDSSSRASKPPGIAAAAAASALLPWLGAVFVLVPWTLRPKK